MKINFTKKQYETLLKAVYLGNWMVSSTSDEPEGNQFDELEEYVFSFAKDFIMKVKLLQVFHKQPIFTVFHLAIVVNCTVT